MTTMTNEVLEQATMYPIKVTLSTGSELNITASRETIEDYYGNVNKLVNEMIYPLEGVARIEVEVYCDFMEENIIEVTHDVLLEAWINTGERVVITYDFNGIEEDERGYLGHIQGWLPKYGIKFLKQHADKHLNTIPADEIVNVRSAKQVNAEAKLQRRMAYYEKNKEQENKKRMENANKLRKERERKNKVAKAYYQKNKEVVKKKRMEKYWADKALNQAVEK